jgi:hypothetical protein
MHAAILASETKIKQNKFFNCKRINEIRISVASDQEYFARNVLSEKIYV